MVSPLVVFISFAKKLAIDIVVIEIMKYKMGLIALLIALRLLIMQAFQVFSFNSEGGLGRV